MKTIHALSSIALLASTAALADGTLDVASLSVSSLTCQANRVSWFRPSASQAPCGTIARYRVYRSVRGQSTFINERAVRARSLVSVYGPAPFTATPPYTQPINDALCAPGPYVAPGGSSYVRGIPAQTSTGWDRVEPGMTYTYSVQVEDSNGVEHPTTVSATITTPRCPYPTAARLNYTLITFADLFPGACATYPCVVPNLPGAPFTAQKATDDLFMTAGPHDRPPYAWVAQQNSPNRALTVTGTVAGWVVLGPRANYCSDPGMIINNCWNATTTILDAARAARGSMVTPDLDGFYVYGLGGNAGSGGVDSNGIGTLQSYVAASGAPPTGLDTKLIVPHEAGHAGLWNKASMLAHANGLYCTGGVSLGPDLREISNGLLVFNSSNYTWVPPLSAPPFTCYTGDYSDEYDTMGTAGGDISGGVGTHYFNSYRRLLQGMILPENVRIASSALGEHRYRLENLNVPSSASSNKLKMLKIPLGDAETYYFLEYRNGSEYVYPECSGTGCAGSAVVPGVYVRLKARGGADLQGIFNPMFSGPFDFLLKREYPAGSGTFIPLRVNATTPTYCDSYRGIQIDFLRADPTGNGGVDSAEIRVTRGARCQD